MYLYIYHRTSIIQLMKLFQNRKWTSGQQTGNQNKRVRNTDPRMTVLIITRDFIVPRIAEANSEAQVIVHQQAWPVYWGNRTNYCLVCGIMNSQVICTWIFNTGFLWNCLINWYFIMSNMIYVISRKTDFNNTQVFWNFQHLSYHISDSS